MDETEGFQCLGHSNWTTCSPLSQSCSEKFPTFSLSYWEANSNYPRGLIVRKVNYSNSKSGWDSGSWKLTPSNWTICNLLKSFCYEKMLPFLFSYWEAISYYPRGLIMGKGKFASPEMEGTEGIECLGHSNWTICSPLSQFHSEHFQTLSLSYWEANSYYPWGSIMGKGNSPNFKSGWDWGFLVPWGFQLDHLQPFAPLTFWYFSNFYHSHNGRPILINPEG